MKNNLSNNAIIYALLALDGEISLQREYLESDAVPDEDLDGENELLEDLEQAFMEFVDVYKERRHEDNELPTLEDLLENSL